jgi:2-methylaconitate cis-trans-isomerase PrpF
VETIKVRPDGLFNENGDHKIGGVIGTGSEIKVAFVDPAGSMTGKLFPTGQRKDILEVSSFPGLAPFTVCSTLIDVANPFILVDSATLPQMYHQIGPSAPESLQIIEAIRRTGAVKYRLAKDTAAASLVRGTPKIAILSSPEMRGIDDAGSDIEVTAFSMGKVHPTLQLTGAVCFGAAVCIEGTIAHELSKELYPTPPRTPPNELGNGFDLKSSGERQVRIRHRGGVIHVNVKIGQSISGNVEVEKVTVSRTARRLFEGNVLFIA